MSESNNELKTIDEIINGFGFGKFQLILVIIGGIIQACDAIEIMVITFLGPLLTCSWQISLFGNLMITTAVFVGLIIGGIFFGKLCDYYGRKPILLLSVILLMYFGLLSTGSPSLEWMIIFRGIIGACIGGVMTSLVSIGSEIIGTKYRGFSILFVLTFWPLGSYFIAIISMLTNDKLSWRWFLLFSNSFLIIALIVCFWIPESPRFLLLNKSKDKALKVINKIAKMNNKELYKDIKEINVKKYSFNELFHPNYKLTTILCMVNWFVIGLSYYGGIIFITIVNTLPRRCLQNLSEIYQVPDNKIDLSCCTKLTMDGYKDTFISITGELVFIPISYILIESIGRRGTMGIFSLAISILFILLNLCVSMTVYRFFLFSLRGLLLSIFNTNYIYASEVFPTSVRSFGISVCNASAKIGSIFAPFMINFLISRVDFLAGTVIFAFLNLIAVICVVYLPYETTGRKLAETANDIPEKQIIKIDYGKIK